MPCWQEILDIDAVFCEMSIMEPYEKSDLKNSIYDGIFANMFATLTGGVFLTGFALYVGMDEFMIGLLASMPFLATIFQLPTSYLISKTGRRKKAACWGATGARLIWIPILIVALLPATPVSSKALLILGLVFVSYAIRLPILWIGRWPGYRFYFGSY